MPDPRSGSDVEHLLREAGPAALAVLLRQGERFADAEDAVQDAVLIAIESWPTRGMPDHPVGWLVRVAQRRQIDRHHRDTARRRRESVVTAWSTVATEPAVAEDDTLALLFLCCHAALGPSASIPLTLRAVGGLTTREIAEALLQREATIAQRISRAKAAITQSGEPFRRPSPDLIDDQLPAVLQVIHLIFNEGHSASTGAHVTRADLADEAIRLARLVRGRLGDRPETNGLLALLLLADARRPARTTHAGELVPLDQQDRKLWSRPMIVEGIGLLTASFALQANRPMGDYQLQAAIAAVHDQAPSYAETNWVQLRALYNVLAQRSDNPVVRLNRAVAVAHTDGPETALGEVLTLAPSLADHHRYHATIGYLHRMSGSHSAARDAYLTAGRLAKNEPERRYLLKQAES